MNKTGGAPLVSFVVPTLNAAGHIGGALESLAGQTCRDFEVVVADGASTDGTLALVESYRDRLPAVQVLSGRDGGIYQGINRGIAASSGTWVHVLGSDDRIAAPGTLAELAKVLAHAQEELVYGDVRMCGPNPFVAPGGRYRGEFTLEQLTRGNICQQAIFYRRTLLQRLGGFDVRYRISADWAFALQAFVVARVRWMDVVVCDYACTGLSSRQPDRLFMTDLPRLLAAIVRRHPLDRRLQPLRWRLLALAQEAGSTGRRADEFRLRLSWLWLSLASRLPAAGSRS